MTVGPVETTTDTRTDRETTGMTSARAAAVEVALEKLMPVAASHATTLVAHRQRTATTSVAAVVGVLRLPVVAVTRAQEALTASTGMFLGEVPPSLQLRLQPAQPVASAKIVETASATTVGHANATTAAIGPGAIDPETMTAGRAEGPGVLVLTSRIAIFPAEAAMTKNPTRRRGSEVEVVTGIGEEMTVIGEGVHVVGHAVGVVLEGAEMAWV
jgi:hypothetical protein